MDIVTIVLRLLHIVSGVFWVGSAVFINFFLEPTARKNGPAGGAFMSQLSKSGMSQFFMITPLLTVLAGFTLYWRDSAGFQLAWITSPSGIGFTLGGLGGITSFLLGATQLGPRTAKMGKIGEQMAASGGKPSPDLIQQMQKIQEEIARIGKIDLVLLLFTLVMMATARYW